MTYRKWRRSDGRSRPCLYPGGEDALIVRRLARAGAIMVGKTTTPEFAYGSLTESPLWGVTRNPWNTERAR